MLIIDTHAHVYGADENRYPPAEVRQKILGLTAKKLWFPEL
jgi:predicted TIM-barrel fold metal-dependent hydrolase